MKKSLIITSIFIGLIGFTTNFIYDKFTQLSAELSDLKLKNNALLKKQKELDTKNKALTKKQNDIKNKMSQRKKDLFQQKLSRAKKKLGKATVSAVPFIGTASVVGVTYWEMQNYCSDIQEFKKFEESLFAEKDNYISEEEKALCGFDYQTIENIVLKDINNLKLESKDWVYKTYKEWNHKFSTELNEIKAEYMDSE